ncbi:MAG: type II toxin-antitoxin system RelE/ParE family toxin [Nitrospirae bacterium]|nr:type II toxin-antitoxin system RelE/ParE family toxin [Nitrospirota bacterium]
MGFTYNFAKINNKVPMIDFLESLSIKERAKIFAYIDKLVELKSNGIQPKEDLSKHLGNGIFELRISFESRIFRCLYFYDTKRELVFTHGFVKKGQKMPKREIEKALSTRKALRGEK